MSRDTQKIRSFTGNDQKEARQIILDGLAEHFNSLDPSLNSDLVDIGASYLDLGDLFLVAEKNKRIIATGALVRESSETGRIVRVSVAAGERRMGLGKKVVRCLLADARDLNLKIVLVETNHDWHEAIAFYKGLGFSEFDRDSESTHMSLKIS